MIDVIHRPSFRADKLLTQLGVGSPTASNAGLRIATMCRDIMLSTVSHCVHLRKCRQLLYKEKQDGFENRPCLHLPQVSSGPMGAGMLSLA